MPAQEISPRLSLSPRVLRLPDLLSSVVMPSLGGSANPMNLAAWVTLSGAVVGIGGGIATALEAPAAVPLLAIGSTLVLVGPSLSYLVNGEMGKGLIQLALRIAAAGLLAGGLLWGISGRNGPMPFVVAGAGGLGLAGLTL